MREPYYQDDLVKLYCGRMEDVLPELEHTSSMWCFGSMRMFLDRRDEFAGWKLSQDVVWEKHNGSGFASDRFKRVHEFTAHWYRGEWATIRHEVPRILAADPRDRRTRTRKANGTPHTGDIGTDTFTRDGTRLQRSVIFARSMKGQAIHRTEKPVAVLSPLLKYAVSEGGVVLDPFAGSCSTLLAARQVGRRAVGIEADEAMCEKAVKLRLSVPDLFGGVVA